MRSALPPEAPSMLDPTRSAVLATFALLGIASAPCAAQSVARVRPSLDTVVAIVGATVIDGNGGAALADATIVVRGKRIAAVGPRASITVPKGSRVIDGSGKFATPGFIDTNV